jgi:hypothetical protein
MKSSRMRAKTDNAKTATKLLVALTGKASPAKATEGDEPVFAYIASLPQPHDLDQRQAASWMKQTAAMPFIGGRPGIGWPASLTRVQGSSVAPRR